MKQRIFFITIFLTLIIELLSAQSFSNVYTLDTCIQIALANNYQLKANKKDVQLAEQLYKIQKGEQLPSINFEAQYLLSDQYGDYDNYGNALFKIYQPIWQNGKLKNAVKEAKLNTSVSDIQFQINQNDIIYYTTVAYIKTVKNERIKTLSNKILKQFLITVDAAKERLKLGIAKRSDVLKAQTEYSNLQYLTIQSSINANVTKQNLITLLALNSDTSLFTVDSIYVKNTLLENSNFSFLINTAKDNLPELQLVRMLIEKQETSILVAKKNQHPEIGAFANYSWTNHPLALKELYGTIGVSLRLSIFNGWKKKTAVAKEEIKYEKLTYQKEELLQSIISEIRITQLELKQTIDKVENAKLQVESSVESLKVIKEEYLQGISSMLELIDAQYAYFNSNVNLATAKADYQLSIAKLKRKIGLN